MKQWLKEQVMMATLIFFHWNRLALAIERYRVRGEPARPFAGEPDWLIGMLMHAYSGNSNAVGRMAYAMASTEWAQRQVERKLGEDIAAHTETMGTVAAPPTAARTEELS